MSHFEALRAGFAAAEGGDSALSEVASRMELEPDLAAKIYSLEIAGWEVVIVSAGCSWYVDRLLRQAGVSVPVFANPGDVIDGQLIMRRPLGEDYYSESTGVDKARLVRSFQDAGRTVAFAGDGLPDLEAALLTPSGLRFARSDLARTLESRKESYRPFDSWADIVDDLTRNHRVNELVETEQDDGGDRL
jgi:2-hydroxy-3-keto-5-methylthiopentenyl-1-phosphate phosphatase